MKKFLSLHWDFIGFSSSTLCAIHCVAFPLLLTMGSLQSSHLLHSEWLEWSLILLTLCIASIAIARGFSIHKKQVTWVWMVMGFVMICLGHQFDSLMVEASFNGAGGLIIAYAHYLNWSLIHSCARKASV